jgi:hypothetical protein
MKAIGSENTGHLDACVGALEIPGCFLIWSVALPATQPRLHTYIRDPLGNFAACVRLVLKRV